MLGRAVQRLIYWYAVKPGSRAVVVGSNDRALNVAADLMWAGVDVLAYADHRNNFNEAADSLKKLRAKGVKLMTGTTVLSAEGSSCLQGAK